MLLDFEKQLLITRSWRIRHGNRQVLICDKTFKNSFILKQHKLIHTGETIYQCSMSGDWTVLIGQVTYQVLLT